MTNRPEEVEEALEYAKTYWAFGDSPGTQQALTTLWFYIQKLESENG